ncbi:DNA mismatch repair endonuclease MutL [Candidatus Sumerlaeota bacterium]|nr:DNA mismatch repair endonuclease MutL [Candidatus Sumerlaeota bacterium]
MSTQSSRIQILPKTLINQIAAGEVIVRPASVAKELIENSIDAGATQISLEVSENVRDIVITDDGCGMTPEEAPLSLQRHATSKISTLEDLIEVKTRGFRGEALASIAAVSRLNLVTRTPDSLSGFRLDVEGGEILKSQPTGAPIGTSISVRDIFFNTPARLKFMRLPSTELKRLLQVVTQQALSHPEIGFTVLSQKRKLLELPAHQSLEDRLRQILGSSLEGMLLPIEPGNLPVTIHGFVAKPEASRKDRSGQFFFVNRRPISNRLLTVTFEQAFKGVLMTGRYPVCAIFVFLEPDELDVNVHPTKEEVRFQDERKVGGILHRVISETLRKANLIPYSRLPETPGESAGEKKTAIPASGGFFSTPQRAIHEQFRKKKDAFSHRQTDLGFYEKTKPDITDEIPPRHKFSMPQPQPDVSSLEKESPPVFPQSSEDLRETISQAEPMGQIAGVYIIARCGDGLLLIDQHAAHERILYNRITSRKTKPDVQNLLLPITFEIEASRIPEMQEIMDDLLSFGIELERFGGQSFVIHTLPADLADMDAVALVKDILDAREDMGKDRDAVEARDEIAKRMACHGAIRAGQRLSSEEMTSLIKELSSAALAFTCPHGRPTMILMSKSQLDKQFKRIV